MPIVRRKKTIRGALRDVAIAPFAFLLAGVVLNLAWLVLALILMLLCMSLGREPWMNLIPSKEVAFTLLGVIAFVALAAIPLAIRDYFADGGYEHVLEPSPEAVGRAREFAQSLMKADYDACYQQFSPALRSEMSLAEFRVTAGLFTSDWAPDSIDHIAEVGVSGMVVAEPDFADKIDTTVQVAFAYRGDPCIVLALYLNSKKAYQVEMF